MLNLAKNMLNSKNSVLLLRLTLKLFHEVDTIDHSVIFTSYIWADEWRIIESCFKVIKSLLISICVVICGVIVMIDFKSIYIR